MIQAFPEGISPKVNAVAQLEFEFAYYDVTVQHVSHYVPGTPHKSKRKKQKQHNA